MKSISILLVSVAFMCSVAEARKDLVEESEQRSTMDFGLFQSAAIGLGAIGLLGLGYKTMMPPSGVHYGVGGLEKKERAALIDFDMGSPRFFPKGWGMDQCGEMAICDAHARYNDYGIFALPIIMFFPG